MRGKKVSWSSLINVGENVESKRYSATLFLSLIPPIELFTDFYRAKRWGIREAETKM